MLVRRKEAERARGRGPACEQMLVRRKEAERARGRGPAETKKAAYGVLGDLLAEYDEHHDDAVDRDRLYHADEDEYLGLQGGVFADDG